MLHSEDETNKGIKENHDEDDDQRLGIEQVKKENEESQHKILESQNKYEEIVVLLSDRLNLKVHSKATIKFALECLLLLYYSVQFVLS